MRRRSRASLGIHIGHDRGAAVVENGALTACVAEERLDRRKHSNSPELPLLSIRQVLAQTGVRADKLDCIGISYTNVVIDSVLQQLTDELRDRLGATCPVVGIGHHDCHAYSAFFTSGFEDALILIADGAGDIVDGQLESESAYIGSSSGISLIDRRVQEFGLTRTERRNSFNLDYMHEIDRRKPISLGRKYEQFTYLVGFGHGQSGKTMGLAAYAGPLFVTPPPKVSGVQFDLTFEDGLTIIDALWKASGQPFHGYIKANAPRIAAAAQNLLESYMVEVAQSLSKTAKQANLCLAGGVFLNCKLNHEILSRTAVERLHIFPAAGDDGQSVGAAFAAYAKVVGTPTNQTLKHAYWGPTHSVEDIHAELQRFGLTGKRMDDAWLCEKLAGDLAEGKIAGLLRGASEIGPRALCHRSILADPRRAGMKDCLNYLKGRELFRPFAPVVTAEAQFRYFDLEQTSPFMLLATTVKPEFRDLLPAVVHADGTSRVQAVDRDIEPFVHDLLTAFETLSGYPVLLNTSFNLAGDPIVESPRDAITTFLASDLDILVLESVYVDKRPAMPRAVQ